MTTDPVLHQRLPPSPYTEPLLRAKLPGPIVEVTRVLLDQITPAPEVSYLLAQFGTDSARHLKEAWRAGERDKGRLAYLVARYVLRMPPELAWGAVTRVAHVFPGSVDPAFLAEAEGHVRATFGAMRTTAEDSERWTPWFIAGFAALAAWMGYTVLNLPEKSRHA